MEEIKALSKKRDEIQKEGKRLDLELNDRCIPLFEQHLKANDSKKFYELMDLLPSSCITKMAAYHMIEEANQNGELGDSFEWGN